MDEGVEGQHLTGPAAPGPGPRDLAQDAGQTAEPRTQYGVLGGGEQFAGGDPAADQLQPADSQDGDQYQRPTTAAWAPERASTRQVRCPCRCSSGSGSRIRRSSRAVVPAAAIVRMPVSDSVSRVAILPWVSW
jgi:hypothetical protein